MDSPVMDPTAGSARRFLAESKERWWENHHSQVRRGRGGKLPHNNKFRSDLPESKPPEKIRLSGWPACYLSP